MFIVPSFFIITLDKLTVKKQVAMDIYGWHPIVHKAVRCISAIGYGSFSTPNRQTNLGRSPTVPSSVARQPGGKVVEKYESKWESSSPRFGVKIPNIFELPPPGNSLRANFFKSGKHQDTRLGEFSWIFLDLATGTTGNGSTPLLPGAKQDHLWDRAHSILVGHWVTVHVLMPVRSKKDTARPCNKSTRHKNCSLHLNASFYTYIIIGHRSDNNHY